MFQTNVPLHELCTFGIGGPARFFVAIHTIDEMQQALITCYREKIPFLILGKGSNCLFDDRGFDGAIILNKIDFTTQQPSTDATLFNVGAGYSFSLLGTKTARQGFSGLEFASGIPGSVGGAVFMNAGANGVETCSSLTSVDFITEDGELCHLKKNSLNFAYRTSSFQTMTGAIVGASFSLLPCAIARQKQIEIMTYRKRTQPYTEKSAGCIFRNPSCGHAGALIEQSGLKGMAVGGAKISEVHANFIINFNQARCSDVLTLIDLVKEKVKEKTGLKLESEVRYISYDGLQTKRKIDGNAA